jgi:hypothetical protein
VSLRSRASIAKRNFLDRRQARAEQTEYERYRSLEFADVTGLLEAHFSTWSEPTHVNRPGFEQALACSRPGPLTIIETGTSAWGTDSTRLWDAYVQRFGGEFWSVDLSAAPSSRLAKQVCDRTHLVVQDSVSFLNSFVEADPLRTVDLCYLDSWDVDWADPQASMDHGLAEFHAIAPLLRSGSVLLIDDTPTALEYVPPSHTEQAQRFLAQRGFLPGKGALVIQELQQRADVRKIWEGYSVGLAFE